MYGSHNRPGFTVIELMMVIAIILIMGAIATPTLYTWLPNIHFRDATQNLQYDMNLAKMTALKQSCKVYVRLADTGDCPASSASFPAQASSYTVSVENDDGSETTIKTANIPGDVTLCNCADVTFSDEISFLPNGLPDIATAVGTCIVNNNLRQAGLKINLTGNVAMDE